VRIWTTIADARQKADLVFTGTVTNLKPDPDGVVVTFDVDLVWKGPRQERLVLPLYRDLESFIFVKGEKYLVFADHLSRENPLSKRIPTVAEPVFEISLCSATRAVKDAGPALRTLGRGARAR